MHLECLPEEGRKVLSRLNKLLLHYDFVLAGGTALALHLGHRMSVDLDFFTQRDFSTETVVQKIRRLALKPKIMQEESGTLNCIVEGVKVSMFRYPYPFVEQISVEEKTHVAGILDIASMKIIAISQRGAKRDFVDLFFILQNSPFWKIAENMISRFGSDRINPIQIGKSMVYFDDAETDPEPEYLKEKPEWRYIKKFLIKNVKQMTLDLQNAIAASKPIEK